MLSPFAPIRLARKLLSLLLILLVAFPLWCTTRIWWTGTHAEPVRSDVIVVLGAAQFDGRPSAVLQARLERVVRVYEAHLAARIITVGAGAPGDRTTEAEASKRWLIANGIPAEAVFAVPSGRDTLTSLKAVQQVLRVHAWSRVVLVTDSWHCLRAETMARDQGMKPSCAPATRGPARASAPGAIHYLIRETGAYLAYVTLGRFGIHLTDRGSSVTS